MRVIYVSIAIICLMFIPWISFSETPEEYRVKDEDLTLKNAEANLDAIEEALKDYRNFTDTVLKDEVLREITDKTSATVIITSEDLKKLSTINWGIQNIGFTNWVIKVRGTLLKADYLTKKYEYDLAKSRKTTTEKELASLQEKAHSARDRYQQFLSRVTLVD